MFAVDATNRLQTLTKELANFEEMAHSLLPQPGRQVFVSIWLEQ